MSVLTQRADRDCGDVTLVDRGRGNAQIRPPDNIAGANLRRPPAQGICGEHAWPQERPVKSRSFNPPFDLLSQRSGRVGLLEERVWRLEGRGEEYDAPCMLCNSFQSGNDSFRRGGPHQEHSIDAIQAGIKRIGTSEISTRYLNSRRQTGRIRVASQGA